MSWLGVNLNDSLSNIKGQISSFTRDVLAEEDENRDDEIEVRIPKKRIKEYETNIYLCQQEIKELKASQHEAEDRLRAADYNSLQKISSLQKQLNETREELRLTKEKGTEWRDSWVSDAGTEPFSNHSNQLPGASYDLEDHLQEVKEERRRHEEEVLALQEAHRAEISRLRGNGEDGPQRLRQESHEVPAQNAKKDEEKNAKITQLQDEVNRLRVEHDSACAERDQLSTSLDELDSQHQHILDEILRSKRQLTEDLNSAKEELSLLKKSCEETQTLKGKVETLTRENEELRRLLEEYSTPATEEKNLADNEQEVVELSSELSEEREKIAKLELEELSSQLSEEREKTAKMEREINRLSKLAREMDENSRQNISRLEGEAAAARRGQESLDYENATLRKRLSSKEVEYDSKCDAVTELNDKIVTLEEEVLKLEAVLEAKNIEHTNVFHKLKQHEEMTKLTLQEMLQEKEQLERRIRDNEIHPNETQGDLNILEKNEEILNKLITLCALRGKDDVVSCVEELTSEVAALRCERDRLSDNLTSTNEELGQVHQLLQNLEAAKNELERENEDLRDELEVQCGERPPPEGSLTPRSSLPTIEEEEMETSLTQADESEGSPAGKKDLLQKIEHLTSQVSVLNMSRTCLKQELEAAKEKNERMEKQFEISPAGGSTELLQKIENLTSQVSTLNESKMCLKKELEATKEENERMEKQVETIQNLACEEDVLQQKAKLERQIEQMNQAMSKMHFDSAHLSSREVEYLKERENLLAQVNSQNKTIHEYFHEIARLKTRVDENANNSAYLKEYREKVNALEDELDKVKGLVIYKDDQIDQLTQQVEQIGQIFGFKDVDRECMYMCVRQEHCNLQAKLKKMEEELETLKEEAETEEETDDETQETDNATIDQLQTELDAANSQLQETRTQLQKLKETYNNLLKERESQGKEEKLESEKKDLHLKEVEIQLRELKDKEHHFKETEAQIVHVKSENDKLTAEKQDLIRQLETTNTVKEELEQRCNVLSDTTSQSSSTLQAKLDEFSALEQNWKATENKLKEKIENLEQTLVSKSTETESLCHQSKEIESLQNQMTSKSTEIQSLQEQVTSKSVEIDSLHGQLTSKSTEIERVQQQLTSKFTEIESLQELLTSKATEMEILQQQLTSKSMEIESLQELLTSKSTEIESLHEQLTSKSIEIDNLQGQLTSQPQEIETLQAELTSRSMEIQSLHGQLRSKSEEMENLQNLVAKTSSELEQMKSLGERTEASDEAHNEEIKRLQTQISELRLERQQMIITSTQKHQESVSYYQEIQRLSERLLKVESERELLNGQLSRLTEENLRSKQEAESLRQELSSTQKEFIPKKQAEEEKRTLKEEVGRVNEELWKQQELSKAVTKERDQLRMANSSFHSQYEEKRKEYLNLQEKEKHLTQEVLRLKQHLVEIEETYTSEAVKSEERETALRQSLARMHEKMASHSTHYSNANQKTSLQLDLMQKKLQEAVHERDEAKLQLQSSEEASLQHEEALTRLQQVLQDFQKNQSRDITMATERERRKCAEEREKVALLESQLKRMKENLEKAEVSSATSKALREELQSKEDTIIALKTQVHAVQIASKKNQDQMALLQSSVDGKVDKHLIRNLVVGYFATPSDKRPEVLRVVAQVLDFSPEERSRAGIDQQPGSWLNSIANFLAPPPSNIRVASKVDVLDHSSLSQAFIRFLEEESSPRTQPRLPAVQMAEEAHQKAKKKAQMNVNPPIGSPSYTSPSPTPPLVPGTASVGGTSGTSAEAPNPLLFYSASTLPQDFPLISTPATVSTTPILSQGPPPNVSTPRFLNNLLNAKETKTEQEGHS